MRLRTYLLPLLALVTFAVFARALGHGYVSYDDGIYAQSNEMVRAGLTPRGVGWAFTTFHGSTWLPVTWLSYMLDATIWDGAFGHHLTNVLLHTLNALLLFRWFARRSGALWTAALAAALFALHPLRVESVAWISSRKDVLSGTFFLWTLFAYGRWVDGPTPRRYALLCLVYALGLASKQTLLTLPFVLLLLDGWPLGRADVPLARRVTEKLPLFALAVGAGVLGWLAQRAGLDTRLAELPFDTRAWNALSSYGAYLVQTVSATGLSAHYTHPGTSIAVGPALAAAAGLAVLTALAWLARKRTPALLVGWLWFLGVLVPMLGLSTFGHDHARADRFTYLPHMGLFVALAYGGAALARSRPGMTRFLVGFALVWLGWFGLRSVQQCGAWKDTESLWEQALRVDPDDATAHYNLGVYHGLERGEPVKALVHLQEAVRMQPDFPEALGNLGMTLVALERPLEAEPLLRRLTELTPDDAQAHLALASTLDRLGALPQAAASFARAAELRPDDLDLRVQVGHRLAGAGQKRAGAAHLLHVATLRPTDAQLPFDAGRMLADSGAFPEAIEAFKTALARRPSWVEALTMLARVQDAAGRPKACVRSWLQVVAARPEDARARFRLGVALAKAGQTAEARAALGAARAQAADDAALIADIDAALARL